MRLLTSPSAVHVAVWQELYFRWCTLTEMTVRLTFEQTTHGPESKEKEVMPVGDNSLPMEVRSWAVQFTLVFLMLKFRPSALGPASAVA